MNSAPPAGALRSASELGGTTSTSVDVRERGVALDGEPRIVTLPPDLVDALADAGDAGWSFADLSADHQRRLVLAIERATTAERRRRRIARVVATLRAGHA